MPDLVPDECNGTGPYDNLIIEGDNFDALRLLRTTHAHKIRVIYIDPPYNTGEKDWVYNDHYVGKNDRYRHSMWLEFLFQRLTLARDLLTPDGVILVSINDENRSRLELLMDEVFAGMRRGSMVWKTRSGTNLSNDVRLSNDHEHILVYGRGGFSFRGEDKDFSQYKNPDNDPRGRWKTGDLTLGFTWAQRRNLYYPIQNANTGVWYPCNPSRVWAFASEKIVEDVSTLRKQSMEQYIREEKILFPDPASERVEIWNTMEELLAAIESGDVPIRPKTKTPILSKDLPGLEFWVGKPVGFGRPWFKRHLRDLQSEVRAVSSWIKGASDDADDDDFVVALNAQRSGTGEHSVNEILGFQAFAYPKPPSLMLNLLRQATNPGDTVLDFFAGSGTTAHAVLALNSENLSEIPRKFIMVSSREATAREPARNVCLDICAERIRRVSEGYGTTKGFGGDFAYLRLNKINHADAFYDLKPETAWHSICLKHVGRILPFSNVPVATIAASSDSAILFCFSVDDEALMQLASHPAYKLRVYSDRPDSVASYLLESGKLVDSSSWMSEAIKGQGA
ncbi:site-specific DNA-methyltransferase [Undibacterium sp. Xuan67W]|uniref:site-specific DNA-methyltransferase n=1 Tax=Undibacterium sp. Xuan67W TaxID=3413057 RepID=UPI003BF03D80